MKLTLTCKQSKWLLEYPSLLAFGSVTLFFSELERVGVMRFLRFSRKRQDRSVPIFFQGLGKKNCSLQPALKNTAPGL